jgi:hypothetical protein
VNLETNKYRYYIALDLLRTIWGWSFYLLKRVVESQGNQWYLHPVRYKTGWWQPQRIQWVHHLLGWVTYLCTPHSIHQLFDSAQYSWVEDILCQCQAHDIPCCHPAIRSSM